MTLGCRIIPVCRPMVRGLEERFERWIASLGSVETQLAVISPIEGVTQMKR